MRFQPARPGNLSVFENDSDEGLILLTMEWIDPGNLGTCVLCNFIK